MDISHFLKLMVEKNGSDMFLSTGAPIQIKVEGKLYPLGTTSLPPGLVERIAYSLMDREQVEAFERDMELNMAMAIHDAGRAGRERAIRDFSWATIAAQTVDIYRSLI